MRIYHKYPSFHTLNTKSNSSVTHTAIAALIITCQCAYENLKSKRKIIRRIVLP